MYAIIEDGGRQYKVQEGQELEVDYRGLNAGQQLTFDQVLAYSDDSGVQVGQPVLGGASVAAEVVGVTQGTKIFVRKLRRRKNSRRRTGHRQMFNKVRIQKIEVG